MHLRILLFIIECSIINLHYTVATHELCAGKPCRWYRDAAHEFIALNLRHGVVSKTHLHHLLQQRACSFENTRGTRARCHSWNSTWNISKDVGTVCATCTSGPLLALFPLLIFFFIFFTIQLFNLSANKFVEWPICWMTN